MMVAPIITATYALDVMDDKKSQTLEFWTKKFLHTVFIQLFHVFIYVALILPLITGTANTDWIIRPTEVGNYLEMGILTVFGMLFFFKAETLLQKRFGIQAESTSGTAGATMVVLNKLQKEVSKGIKTVSKYKDTKLANDQINNSMNKPRKK